MDHDELADLIDLSLDDELPEALKARLERHLAAHPDAARDRATLQQTLVRLRALAPVRPDDWFVERTLDVLLRDSSAADSLLRREGHADFGT